MRLGPLRLVRDATIRRLLARIDTCSDEQVRLAHETERLNQELARARETSGDGGTPSPDARRLEAELADIRHQLHAHRSATFMHYPLRARIAPLVVSPPDESTARTREAAARIIDAYHRAMSEFVAPDPSMWDHIAAHSEPLLRALRDRDVDAVERVMAGFFQGPCIWGLGEFFIDARATLASDQGRTYFQQRCADALVNLAEAVGEQPITSLEQRGVEPHLDALNVDQDDLLRRVEARTGFDLAVPDVGAPYGCRVGDKLVTIDVLVHSYVVHRLRQLGADAASEIVEIGGGYGCLAALAARAGLPRYTIVDLPWVNAVQGFFLIRALPSLSVRLYGEDGDGPRVLPHWCFGRLADRSIDFVVNSNSLPEMGREAGRAYIRDIARVLRGRFVSINQEAMAPAPESGSQLRVAQLVAEDGGLRCVSRSRAWMRQGYVEEVFEPRSVNSV